MDCQDFRGGFPPSFEANQTPSPILVFIKRLDPRWYSHNSVVLTGKILQIIADFTRVKCDMITPPYQGGVQRENLTASRWGVGLSNWLSHSIENRYKDQIIME